VAAKNIETTKWLVDLVNGGDFAGVVQQLPPDFRYDITRTDSPLRGVYTREQMGSLMEEFLGGWERVRYEPDDFIDPATVWSCDSGRVSRDVKESSWKRMPAGS
jgi:hypothetical protein